jgi:hypothetical protein
VDVVPIYQFGLTKQYRQTKSETNPDGLLSRLRDVPSLVLTLSGAAFVHHSSARSASAVGAGLHKSPRVLVSSVFRPFLGCRSP